ncbi:hypothetical protein K2F_15940 [Enterococcus thailandicus]|nr:hypothetical protein K2F_15940 [Enterococcus thailandicus]
MSTEEKVVASSTQLRKNKAFSFKQYEVLSKNSYSFYEKNDCRKECNPKDER